MYLGIDPGLKGGIAWSHRGEMEARRMPETEADTSQLFRDLFHIANEYDKSLEPFTALIERVHAMPKQGVTSCFTFGRGYGFLRGCLISLGIPFDEVTPQRWQREMSCLTGGKKAISRAKAQQLFPSLKITDATADAILICEYNRRLNERK